MQKISLTLFHTRFTLGGRSILGGLVIFGMLCSLGVWQLRRADEKKQWLARHAHTLQHVPLQVRVKDLDEIHLLKQDRLIELTGSYQADVPCIFLDNKMHRHQVGYQVLMPFLPTGHARLVWVNRGWIPRGKDRHVLPPVYVPKGRRVLRGWTHVPEKSGILLGKNIEYMSAKFWRVQRLQLDVLHQQVKRPFYPFEILLIFDATDEALWVRDWKPAVSVTPSKHLAYSIQWFGLAGVFGVGFILVRRRPSKNIF